MSRIFGGLLQIGYVVEDIQDAMQHWATVLHVGPWFYLPHLAIQDAQYEGSACEADISLALAHDGTLQIELIQQHNDVPSIYTEQPCHHGGYQHHLGYASWNFDEDVAFLQRQDCYRLIQTGITGTRGGFAYFETCGHQGTFVEIIDLAHGRGQLFAAIEQAALYWDGSDPIRTKLPL